MSESLGSFAALFRAVLILHGIEPPVAKRDVVQLTVKSLKIDGEPFERIFEIRANNGAPALDEVSANRIFSDYMKQIERVIAAVDMLDT
jgi:hypothetical protein